MQDDVRAGRAAESRGAAQSLAAESRAYGVGAGMVGAVGGGMVGGGMVGAGMGGAGMVGGGMVGAGMGGAGMGGAAESRAYGGAGMVGMGGAGMGDARGELALGDATVGDAATSLAHGSGPVSSPGFFAQLRYLGQLDLTYLVCDGDGELVLVDQHAAHERVELERLRARTNQRDLAIQKLLFPVTIEASPAEIELVLRVDGLLAAVGFEVEPFGKATLAVKAVPAGIRHGDPTALLRGLLAEWAADGAPSEEERLERVLAEIACHSVVRAGDRLQASEAEALLRSLDTCEHAAQGPHGRPVLLRLPLAEVARRFGR